MRDDAEEEAVRLVNVRELAPSERARLLARFDAELYRPAFPDDDIREDPQTWLDLIAAAPGPPHPVVTPILALDKTGAPCGGVVIEWYAAAKAAFLTYIVVAPAARGQGLGRRLARAALEAVRAQNGGATPVVFAEAERPEDAATAEEEKAARERLAVLGGLGALRADFAYVQPPLAPGKKHRRLELLAAAETLGPAAAAPAAQVRAFLEELYRSLGVDPAADDAFAEMAKVLARSDQVRFEPLLEGAASGAGATHVYRESPAFTGVESFSLAYVFELEAEKPGGETAARALRIGALNEALDPAHGARGSELEQARRRDVYQALIEPVRSFHDDVTSGAPGEAGRPLVFGVEPPEDALAPRRVTLIRPPRWRYGAESRRVDLLTPEDKTRLELDFRDTFFAFESGRIFYALSVTPVRQELSKVDEYLILALQKLAHPSWDTGALREQLRFEWRGESLSLIELVEARFKALAETSDPRPNALRDIIAARVLKPGERLSPPSWARLKGAVVGIEDAAMFEASVLTDADEDVFDHAGAEVLDPSVASLASAPQEHLPAALPQPVRGALALAGVLQSVPDFPFQDSSEIWDSTRQIHGDRRTYAIYSHPRFVVEIGTDWRSLRDAGACLGHCPYLLLMWVVAAHDEILAAEMEKELERLIYEQHGPDDVRAEPLAGLRRTLERIGRQALPGPSPALKRSVRLRFELFRRYTINRSRSMFRYEAEASALAAIEHARGTDARFERALDLLDRYGGIVEDVQELGRMESDRRLNLILFVVALLGVVSVFADLAERAWWPFGSAWTEFYLGGLGGAAFVILALALIVRTLR